VIGREPLARLMPYHESPAGVSSAALAAVPPARRIRNDRPRDWSDWKKSLSTICSTSWRRLVSSMTIVATIDHTTLWVDRVVELQDATYLAGRALQRNDQ
jgi:hypothetical protein